MPTSRTIQTATGRWHSFGAVDDLAGKNGEKLRQVLELSQHVVIGYEHMGNNPSYFSREGDWKDKVNEFSDEDPKRFPVEFCRGMKRG